MIGPILAFFIVHPAFGSSNHSAVDITSQLVSDLTDFERSAPTTGPIEPIHACLGLTFRKWADSYNQMLRFASLNYSEIKVKMDEYATHWFRTRHLLAVAEFHYPDLESTLERLYSEGVERSGRVMKPFGEVRFSIDDIDRKTYDLYLKFCLSRLFAERAESLLKIQNDGQALPPGISSLYQGKAGWTPSPQGGLVPVLLPGSPLTPPEKAGGAL
ncbi:MAG: hypothetical protein EBX52_09315 [Proteobacteria bacterium]|nr:hypothetical protein [Pseudomonadota bacterium]